MTKLNAGESALLLVNLAIDECFGKSDLRMQLATIRLNSAKDALQGCVDMQEFERKMLGSTSDAAEKHG